MDRIPPAAIPALCPHCGHSRWWAYRLIPEAPAVGCGRCGHVLYLTDPLGPASQTSGPIRDNFSPSEASP